MALVDVAVKNAKAKDKPYKLADGGGLYLYVTPAGGKVWRLKYRQDSKEKLLTLGKYPLMTLLEAREAALKAKKQRQEGQDPGEVKKATKRQAKAAAANTFGAVTAEWLDKQKQAEKWTPAHHHRITVRLKADILPYLENTPIAAIDTPALLAVIQRIEARGALDIAHRAIQTCGQIFRYARLKGLLPGHHNPAIDLRGVIATRPTQHHKHLTAADLPEFFNKLAAYNGNPLTALGLRLLLLTFVRTAELRGAVWGEFDLEKAEWRIPAERMKMRDPHIVPLSRQAVAVIEQVRQWTGHREHLFPSSTNPSKVMSENTLLYALYRMGYHGRATGHGFRGTASTILNEHGFPEDVIERQLAHAERKQVRAAYNHAQYLPQRREMMQWWADELDRLAGGNVIPFPAKGHG
ncbi:MAG: tyrosine-type recombinase/integrase [Holosporales bacterium]|jgi:integrase